MTARILYVQGPAGPATRKHAESLHGDTRCFRLGRYSGNVRVADEDDRMLRPRCRTCLPA
jgi:hypothetical protein